MVTFDGLNKLIIMDDLVTTLDVRALYAAWKQWVQELDNLKYLRAFDVVGGNPTIGTSSITPYFFLINGWKIRPYEGNHTLKVEGILLTADESDIFVDTIGIFRIGTQSIVPLYAETTEVNNESIVYSSFQGAVWVDVNSAYSDKGSATHPNGNTERPVNNTQLAVEIAHERGFRNLNVIGDLVLDTGDDVRGMHLAGTSHVNSHLVVNTGALCWQTKFSSFDITGVLDGESEINDCVVHDLEYFDGHIHNSALGGVITLSGSADAIMANCSTVDIKNPPVINSNNSLQNLTMPNYSGPVIIANMTAADAKIGIGLDAGNVSILSSCTGGTIGISGIGELNDESSNNCYVVNSLVDGTKLANLHRTIEYLRPHHTSSGDTYYWDPYAGNDEWDGKEVTRAFKTFSAAHDACQDAHHDTIICVSGNHLGLTIATDNITISKDYIFLRGPGRDFIITSASDALDTITITGRGVEVSGMIISTGLTSTKAAIRSTGVFTLIKNVYVFESHDGLIFDNGEYCIADTVKLHHGTGTGIQVIGTSDHTDIIDCHIGSNAIDGVSIDISGGHEVNFLGNNIIHKNTGAGVRISATSAAVIFTKDTEIFLNGTDIVDNGIETFYSDVTVDSDAIAEAVWTDTTRTLTSADANGATAQEVWEYGTRELTSAASGGLDEVELHAALDNYANKDGYKADVSNLSADVNVIEVNGVPVNSIDDFKASSINLQPVLDAISSLQNISLLDIESSTILAKEASISSIASAVASIPTTDSVADLTPVLVAISGLNDVTPSEVRAAFDEAEFKDKNTELEVHAWLDSYSNKDSWKESVSADLTSTNLKIDSVQSTVNAAKAHTDTLANTDISSLATQVSLDDTRTVIDSINALVTDINVDMEALDANNVNSIYAKLLEVRADIEEAVTAGTYKAME